MEEKIRFLKEMRKVLYDQKWAKEAPDLELYYMFRGVKKENGLRYDITIIPPKMLGKEFIKTMGHEHPKDYAELYEVLKGKAIFLIQKRKGNKIEDCYFVKTKKGDKVFIPPHYGHFTINPTKKELKIGNWVVDSFKSNYLPIIKRGGACYFVILENKKLKWIKNKNYKKIPKLRIEKPNKNIPKDLKRALMGN